MSATTTKAGALEALAGRVLEARRRRQEQKPTPPVGAADREQGRAAGRAWALDHGGDEEQLRAAAGLRDCMALVFDPDVAATIGRCVGVRWCDVQELPRKSGPSFHWLLGFIDGVAEVYEQVQAHLGKAE